MERSIFPEIKITPLDVAKAVGDIVLSAVRHLPETGYPSERGAAAMLDRSLYDHPQLPFEG